jgi:hypothetical protein
MFSPILWAGLLLKSTPQTGHNLLCPFVPKYNGSPKAVYPPLADQRRNHFKAPFLPKNFAFF